MKNIIVVDATAIIAGLDRRDQWHKKGAGLFRELARPLRTCEAAITEAWHLLRESPCGSPSIMSLLMTRVLTIDFSLANEVAAVDYLVDKYRDIPISLADACIVRMSEIFDAPVFTFDSDFRIYRRNKGDVIPLIGLDN